MERVSRGLIDATPNRAFWTETMNKTAHFGDTWDEIERAVVRRRVLRCCLTS